MAPSSSARVEAFPPSRFSNPATDTAERCDNLSVTVGAGTTVKSEGVVTEPPGAAERTRGRYPACTRPRQPITSVP